MNMGRLQAAACNPTPSNIITLPKHKAARRPYKSEAKGVKGRPVKLPMNWAEVRRPDYIDYKLIRFKRDPLYDMAIITCLISILEDDQSNFATQVKPASLY